HEFIVVLFNANDEAQTITVAATAGTGLSLHPLQTGLAASFDDATGTFTVPGRTTAVFIDGGPATAATITIALDAVPNSNRNFRFEGDLGSFRLDDPRVDDHDPFGSSMVKAVAPGTYTVSERIPASWRVTAIDCAGGTAAVDPDDATAAITVAAGNEVICTFVNKQRST
ncbi:MAG: DUF3372 domain-containing protein, partial [Caldilineaceae bacterium]|nr:DUF3372 domain-containing protein [Caldilineaceae bacterium]